MGIHFLAIINIFVLTGVKASEFAHGCHLVLEGAEGVVVGRNESCNYDISTKIPGDSHSSVGCGIRLTFEEFEIEGAEGGSGFCTNSFLSIHSCVPEGGNRFCGNGWTSTSHEYALAEDASHFRLTFVRNKNSSADQRFKIRYWILERCSGLYWKPPISTIPGVSGAHGQCFTQLTESNGTINSPHFPNNYPNQMDCVYEFLRESREICGIRMRVLVFELEDWIDSEGGGACADFFHLVGGCGFMCGRLNFIWTAKFQPGATRLKFHFHSDEGSNGKGFKIAFQQITLCS